MNGGVPPSPHRSNQSQWTIAYFGLRPIKQGSVPMKTAVQTFHPQYILHGCTSVDIRVVFYSATW